MSGPYDKIIDGALAAMQTEYERGRADALREATNAIALASIPRSVANGGAQAVRRYLLSILSPSDDPAEETP